MMNRLGFGSLVLLYIFAFPVGLLADFPEKKYLKAFQLSLDGKSHEAIDSYLEVLKLKPEWAEAHHNLGLLYFKIDMGVKALDHFRKAERYYSKRTDVQAKTNLDIVRKNLEKGYKKLDINPQDFEAVPAFSTKLEWHPAAAGFLIGSNGHVLTSWQTVEQANRLRVRFPNGRTLEAKPIRKFIVYNIALLKIDNFSQAPKTVLKLGDSSILKKGEWIFVPGLSSDSKLSFFPQKGTIRMLNALEDNDKFFQIDVPIHEERNGAPLFNSQGDIIGMLFSKSFMEKSYIQTKDLSADSSFAIKSTYLQRILGDILNTTPPVPIKKSPILIDNSSAFSSEAQMNLVTIVTIP